MWTLRGEVGPRAAVVEPTWRDATRREYVLSACTQDERERRARNAWVCVCERGARVLAENGPAESPFFPDHSSLRGGGLEVGWSVVNSEPPNLPTYFQGYTKGWVSQFLGFFPSHVS